jgi:flavin-dependent dehydrogenase
VAKLGYAVCLLERDNCRRPNVESLAPATGSLLKTLGVLGEIRQAGFVRCEQTRLRWFDASDALQGGRTAVIVERDRFDRILLEAARRAGVSVLCPARALIPARRNGGWSIPVRTASGSITIQVRFLVDARGKRAALLPNGTSTVALSCRYREAGLPVPEMRVEACSHAWLWGAPLADGSFAAVAFVDTSRCNGLARDRRSELYRSLLDRSRLFRPRAGVPLVGDVRVRDATPRVDENPVTESSIKIGDRALSLDPLSSQGLQWAIRSGLQASAVINTVLSGGDKLAAIEFYRNMHCHSARLHCRLTREVYASQSLYTSPFWSTRAGASSSPPEMWTGPVLSPEIRLRLSGEARVMSLPIINGDMICRRTALSHPGLDQPVAWLDDIELGPLLAILGAERSAAEIISEWSRRMLPGNAARVLYWLTRHGILVAS